jgi:K+-transporting ATPase c subunit
MVNFFRLWHPGKPRVNVLELNLALDATYPRK